MVDLLSAHPYLKALDKIADLRKLCHPDDRAYLDACLPSADPHLYEAVDRDNDLDIHSRGIDATEWRPAPSREQYRPSRMRTSVPVTARVEAERNNPEKYRERRRKAQAHRRERGKIGEPAIVTDYFTNRLFEDNEAAAAYDYLALRARIYHNQPQRHEEGRPHRRTAVVDAEEARAKWDQVYVGCVGEQLDLTAIVGGDRPISEEQTHWQAQKRTKIWVAADDRDPFQENGNDLDYDHASTPALVGWPCVSCFIERPGTWNRAAKHRIDGRWRSDDGLCPTCRADGRHGMPPLPQGFTNRDLVIARCAYFTEHYPRSADHILDRVIRAQPHHPAVPIIRDCMSPDYGQLTTGTVDLDDATAPKPKRTRQRGPALGRGQRQGRCAGCFQVKPVYDDDHCTTCRVYLGIVEVPDRRQAVAA
ncbi:hypothetical protein [Nocardia sp. CA-119907]|uniref:hypothetical protein n=1 Tax=Nocardia sp. CA-119907 TaxID=3239973 RepID=UPI003D9773E6